MASSVSSAQNKVQVQSCTCSVKKKEAFLRIKSLSVFRPFPGSYGSRMMDDDR